MRPTARDHPGIPGTNEEILIDTATPTHVIGYNGAELGELRSSVRSVRDQLAMTLGTLDGSELFAFKLAAMPVGVRYEELHESWRPGAYMQCAGRADELAIEVRTLDERGHAHQYAVGRGGFRLGKPNRVIPYADRFEVRVHRDEVFALEAAVDVFFGYYETGRVPDRHRLRELDQYWAR